MRDYHVYAWLLRRLVPAAHADALLGDLLEISGTDDKANLRILRSTVWSLGRRILAAYIAAVLSGALISMLQGRFFASLLKHDATIWQRSWGSTLAFLVGSTALMFCFSAVRYGLRDRMTSIALACTVLGAFVVQFWWVPLVPFVAGVCFFGVGAFSVMRRKTRRSFTSFMTLAVLQPILWFGGLTLMITPVATLLKHSSGNMPHAAPLVATWLVATYLAIVMLVCLSYAKAHRIAASNN
jgi:hypothetical protein